MAAWPMACDDQINGRYGFGLRRGLLPAAIDAAYYEIALAKKTRTFCVDWP